MLAPPYRFREFSLDCGHCTGEERRILVAKALEQTKRLRAEVEKNALRHQGEGESLGISRLPRG
jgi:hypothetical protein